MWGMLEELRRIVVAAGLACTAALSIGAAASSAAASDAEVRTARYLDAIRQQPVPLAMFLQRMPKGGDLHNHLSGAVYAESLIGWAEQDGLCVRLADMSLAKPPCDASNGLPPIAAALKDGGVYHDLIDAFSMRDFVARDGVSGHDQFFATFARFDAATKAHAADMIAEAANRAAADHLDYLELMDSPGMAQARGLAASMPWTDDFDAAFAKLAPGIAPLVAEVSHGLDATEAEVKSRLRCGTAAAEPGCGVTIRYIAQVIRTFPAEQVFAQAAFGYALAAADPRVVGVNLVAPEDDPTTLRDYDKQMRLLGYMGRRYPTVRLSLHAGELTMGLTPTADLRHHIRDAVKIAGARRIGHGVDLRYEDDAAALLREMAAKRVMVEINLTSNDVILGVRGADHPFETYLHAGVPVALSTDDEGVSRIDLTHEFTRAVLTYGLSYSQLKTLARNSLEYAFLPGESLWATSSPYRVAPACAGATLGAVSPPASCRALLKASARAALQWRLEGEFQTFEATDWGR
jgi:adenosine deaminase